MSKLWLWGNNGDGTLGDNTTNDKSSPVQTVTGGTNWLQVAGGYDMTLALKDDGTMWSWGRDDSGDLGLNNATNRSSPCQIGTDTDWVSISASNWYWGICSGIKNDGSLWLWGYNNSGNLGDNTTNAKSSPVQTVTGGNNWESASHSGYHSAAIKTDGTLWIWGGNEYGELGNDDTTDVSSPIQTITGGSNWAQVSCSRDNTAAIKDDGSLWVWGRNGDGQLGTNNTQTVSSPIQTIAGGNDWAQVSFGRRFVGAIKNDGTLWMWGDNSVGQLGVGNTLDISSPVQTILGGNTWAQISCSYYLSAAIKTDGSLWVWGRGGDGQIGNNAADNVSIPTQTVVGGKGWTYVSAGYYHVSAFGTGVGYDIYQVKLTPNARNEGTEGYMDEWAINGVSLQRGAYIEVPSFDNNKNKIVFEVKDGDNITNEPEKLTDLTNGNGWHWIVES